MRAWRYVKGTPGSEPVDVDELDEALDPATALVWIDSDQEPTDEERKHVTTQLGLSPLVVDALANPKPERTKLIQYGDYFHVAVHDCQLAGETLESHEIDIVIGPGWIITVRHPTTRPECPPLDVNEVVRRFELQRSEHGSTEEGFLLWALFDVIIDRYFDVNDAIEDRLDAVEEEVFSDERDTGIPARRLHAPPRPRRVPPCRGPDARGPRRRLAQGRPVRLRGVDPALPRAPRPPPARARLHRDPTRPPHRACSRPISR